MGIRIPTPSPKEGHPLASRKMEKPCKITKQRSSKRTTPPNERSTSTSDVKAARSYKACERCRMKKTKCDGAFPCQRCKDDNILCQAGTRKKAELKQLPRGYGEVLENNQHALIATIQKLYWMIRNNESWDLTEPELNARKQPCIHDIASALGCIRESPDVPYALADSAEELANYREEMELKQISEDMAREKSKSKGIKVETLPAPGTPMDRTFSSDSNDSSMSGHSNRNALPQQQKATYNNIPYRDTKTNIQQQSSPVNREPKQHLSLDVGSPYLRHTSFDSTPSPFSYTDQSPSPTCSPYNWASSNSFSGQTQLSNTPSPSIQVAQLQMTQPQLSQQFIDMRPPSEVMPNYMEGVYKDDQFALGILDYQDLSNMDSSMYNGDGELFVWGGLGGLQN